MRDYGCKAMVRGEVRKGTLDLHTGATKHVATSTETYRCATPLFSRDLTIGDGLCGSCRAKLDAGMREPLPAG